MKAKEGGTQPLFLVGKGSSARVFAPRSLQPLGPKHHVFKVFRVEGGGGVHHGGGGAVRTKTLVPGCLNREKEAFARLLATPESREIVRDWVVGVWEDLDPDDVEKISRLARFRKRTVRPTSAFAASTATLAISIRPGFADFPPGLVSPVHVLKMERGICSMEEVLARWSSEGRPSDELRKSLALHATRCVNACHRLGVFHHDVKSANFMLFPAEGAPPLSVDAWKELSTGQLLERTRLKIADLGFACCRGEICRCNRGSPSYSSPQLVHGLVHRLGPNDVFSLGVLLFEIMGDGLLPYEVLHRREPHPHPNLDHVYLRHILPLYPTVFRFRGGANDPEGFPWTGPLSADPVLEELVERMLSWQESNRPTTAEIIQHPWFLSPLGSLTPSHSSVPLLELP